MRVFLLVHHRVQHSRRRRFYSLLAHSDEWGNERATKVTLHIYSFLPDLLFIQNLVSPAIDEGPSALLRAFHTSGLITYTFEGGGVWCMTVKMQRDRQGFWLYLLLPHFLLPFGCNPLITQHLAKVLHPTELYLILWSCDHKYIYIYTYIHKFGFQCYRII